MLRVVNVSFSYAARGFGRPGEAALDARRPVLGDVSISVNRGAIVGLLGPNGSGKTTLLRLMSGTLRPDAGAVTLDGRSVTAFSRLELARRMAMVAQETHATFDFSALEIVLMGRYPHLGAFQLEGAEDLRIAHDAMVATGTDAFASRPFATLSGGEKQRVVIASALAQASDVLLLDEPTASLDLGFQLEIVDLLTRLNRERHTTMVVSTHDLNLAASLCKEMVLLRSGRVLAAGRSEAVLTPENVRAVYHVDAEVSRHPRTHQLRVTAIGRTR